jgi:hypothetical protein
MSGRTSGTSADQIAGAHTDQIERIVAATLAAALLVANNREGGVTAAMASRTLEDVEAELRRSGSSAKPASPQTHHEAGMRS